jgi:VIT1/CCC1 family predicted Fe2+/Mn2+ transporter
MTHERAGEDRRILDPVERMSEILFGLIMVLSFTGSISVATGGREEIRTILFGAIGCNLAWGLVDAVMYVLQSLIERSRALSILKAVRRSPDPETAHGLISDALPEALAPLMRPSDLEHLRGQMARLPEPPARVHITWTDLRGAAGVFLLVFLSTFPAVIPFLFLQEPTRALRVSNGVAIALLFIVGHRLGTYSGLGPFRSGLAMVAIGAVLVGITVSLGG